MLHEYLLSGFWSMGTLAIIGWAVLGFLGLRCLIVWTNVYFSPKLKLSKNDDEPHATHGLIKNHRQPRLERDCRLGLEKKTSPLISILIPARDEEKNIGKTLEWLQKQSYQHLEILILDDHSTDKTAEVVEGYKEKDQRIRLISGKALPAGWLGKNWACHQLATEAKGEFFLFIDADVEVAEGLLPALVSTQKCYHLQLLSVFPDQHLTTWGEQVVVPIMHELLLSLLPLVWVRLLPFPSMAAANGQVMFFDAETYRQKHLHEKVKKEVVEDIAIAQLLKKEGGKVGVFLGNSLVSCRMYSSYASAVDGFSKNLLAGFGNSILGLLFFISLTTWGYIGLFGLPVEASYWALLLIVLTNIGLAKLSNQHWFWLVRSHIPRKVALVHIAIQSIIRKVKGKNEWKGRNVHIS